MLSISEGVYLLHLLTNFEGLAISEFENTLNSAYLRKIWDSSGLSKSTSLGSLAKDPGRISWEFSDEKKDRRLGMGGF